jgi:polyisoprenoid-binding protein YceI
MRPILTAALLALSLTLLLPAPLAAQEAENYTTTGEGLPAGTYRMDRVHTSLAFRVSHVGFSNFTAWFRDVDAVLDFDPADMATMRVEARVAANSVETNYPFPDFDFNAMVAGPDWLDAAAHPQITFRSTAIVPTGPNTAEVTGDLTLRGVTGPITLLARFNAGYSGHPMDPGGARLGFSATGSLNRSDFGMDYGIPAPGSAMGVGDRVEIVIETEFTEVPHPLAGDF